MAQVMGGAGSGVSAGVSWVNVIKLAGAYCAFCIGSGFASGQEVLQFFTAQGLYSFGALTISMVLFMWFGSAIMLKGYGVHIKATNTIFRYYCGKVLGFAFEIFVPFFVFCVVVIMVSGAGATLAEYYGLNPYLGRAVMAAASIVTIIFGLGRLVKVIGLIGPVIIVVSIIVGIVGIAHNPYGLANVGEVMADLPVPTAAPNWWLSGILYTAFMVLGSAPFFAGLGTEAHSRKEALLGGLMGGFLLIGAAAIMSTGMLCNIVDLHAKEVPALAMAGVTAPWFANLFAVVLILGIFSTAAPMLWSVCNRFSLDGTPRFKATAVIFGVAAFFGGLLPFGQLVGFIYPNSGKIGIFFLICVMLHPVLRRFIKTEAPQPGAGS